MSEELDKRAERIGERLNQGDRQEAKGKGSVKGRPSITMYLPEDLHEKLKTKFLELQLEGNKEGVDLEKNRDFYPKIIKAGLEHLEDEDFLGSQD
uniref:DUF8160 domain-containing protein n=1 Tax=uncultured organism TaxID=155900 RepID=M1QAW8_9ZZZZ|nr:hypothetical protein FLSS-17_0031 [uncultured organism]